MNTSLPFTICFCFIEDNVLMLKRANEPNRHLWNGLGGHIEKGESPTECIYREIMEEADIDLHTATSVHFNGIVTWTTKGTREYGGMYVFSAFLPSSGKLLSIHNRKTREGLLSWLPYGYITNTQNTSVVSNIGHFLPKMRQQVKPLYFNFLYEEHTILSLSTRLIPTRILKKV